MAQTLQVLVRNPETILFEGAADALTSYNVKGLFDVLPSHENFISIIEKEIVVHVKREKKSFPVQNGILQISENKAVALLGV